MVELSRSAHLFLERCGLRPTERRPLPRIALWLTEDHAEQVTIPRPWPVVTLNDCDRGPSTLWPHPESEQAL